MRISQSFDTEILEKIRLLYEASFPKEEKKPFPVMLRKRCAGLMTFFAIFDGGDDFAGFMLTAHHERIVLLDYFAIEPAKRCGGIGSFAISALVKAYADRDIVIEIEDERVPSDDGELRARRKNFYLRAGMKIMPYEISLYGVKMRVLTSGRDIAFDEYHRVYREVFGGEVAENIFLL